MAKKYTIAVLDEEIKERNKFVNFFENDFNVIPINYVSDIDKLIEEIKSDSIDAIAIDYKLRDHKNRFKKNGDYYFKELMERLNDFPAFILTQDSKTAKNESKLIKPRFIIDKEIYALSGISKKEFLQDIRNEIKAYKSTIEEKIKRLKQLEKLKKSKQLDEVLENEYLKLNNDLIESFSGGNKLPMKYFSSETNEKLDEIINKTDKLIKKINENKTTSKRKK